MANWPTSFRRNFSSGAQVDSTDLTSGDTRLSYFGVGKPTGYRAKRLLRRGAEVVELRRLQRVWLAAARAANGDLAVQPESIVMFGPEAAYP
jgi:hypothetical protein